LLFGCKWGKRSHTGPQPWSSHDHWHFLSSVNSSVFLLLKMWRCEVYIYIYITFFMHLGDQSVVLQINVVKQLCGFNDTSSRAW
jgi:hypothetical protein